MGPRAPASEAAMSDAPRSRGRKRTASGQVREAEPSWILMARKAPPDWTLVLGDDVYPVHKTILRCGHSPNASGSEFFRGQCSEPFANGSITQFPEAHPKCTDSRA